jgi:hypothetical protein
MVLQLHVFVRIHGGKAVPNCTQLHIHMPLQKYYTRSLWRVQVTLVMLRPTHPKHPQSALLPDDLEPTADQKQYQTSLQVGDDI